MIPQELQEQMVTLGKEKARTKAVAYLAEKAVKGAYAEAYMQARGSNSQGDAAQIAYTMETYQEAVEASARAMEEAEVAKVEHDAFIARFEGWRSLNASRREQVRAGVYADAGGDQ